MNVRFSDEDNDLRNAYWYVNRKGYAKREVKIDRVQKTQFAHRVVLSRILGRKLDRTDICDHINGDTTDNRRSNIRLTDFRGNAQNRKSRYGMLKGAYVRNSKTGLFRSVVHHQGKQIHLGNFRSALEAAHKAAEKRQQLCLLERMSHA